MHVLVFVCIYICVTYINCCAVACRGQKRILESLKLELHTTESHHVCGSWELNPCPL